MAKQYWSVMARTIGSPKVHVIAFRMDYGIDDERDLIRAAEGSLGSTGVKLIARKQSSPQVKKALQESGKSRAILGGGLMEKEASHLGPTAVANLKTYGADMEGVREPLTDGSKGGDEYNRDDRGRFAPK